MMRPRDNQGNVTDTMDSFRRIVHALRSSHRAAVGLDLTGAQLFVLTALGASDGPISVKELAERTRTDQSTASVVVGRLVNRGLVRRVRSAIDTRRVELSLTARGRALQAKTPATVAQAKLADAIGQLSPADAISLSRILKTIVELMGEADAPATMLFDEQGPESAGKTRRSRQETERAATTRKLPERRAR